MRYSKAVRRNLVVCLIVGSLLWAVTGVSVLAVVVHENMHHTDVHDHPYELQMVIHGHSHEGSHDHDHEISAPPTAARISLVHSAPASAIDSTSATGCDTDAGRRSVGSSSKNRYHGSPTYLMHCVLLT